MGRNNLPDAMPVSPRHPEATQLPRKMKGIDGLHSIKNIPSMPFSFSLFVQFFQCFPIDGQ